MDTSEIRKVISDRRERRIAYYIQSKIDWSIEASARHRFTRWIWSLPSRPYTYEEAYAKIAWSYIYYLDKRAVEICDAIDFAKERKIEHFHLSVDDVNELKKVLNPSRKDRQFISIAS